jgi:hypothetical protein
VYYRESKVSGRPCAGRLFWIWSAYAAAMSWLWSVATIAHFPHGAVWAIAAVAGALVLLATREF